MDAGSAWTRTSSGTSLSEMVTPRLEMMAENSRFKKKVHFGGMMPSPGPSPGGCAESLFLTLRGWWRGRSAGPAGAGCDRVAGCVGDGFAQGVFEHYCIPGGCASPGKAIVSITAFHCSRDRREGQGSRQITRADSGLSPGPSRIFRSPFEHPGGVKTNWSIYS